MIYTQAFYLALYLLVRPLNSLDIDDAMSTACREGPKITAIARHSSDNNVALLFTRGLVWTFDLIKKEVKEVDRFSDFFNKFPNEVEIIDAAAYDGLQGLYYLLTTTHVVTIKDSWLVDYITLDQFDEKYLKRLGLNKPKAPVSCMTAYCKPDHCEFVVTLEGDSHLYYCPNIDPKVYETRESCEKRDSLPNSPDKLPLSEVNQNTCKGLMIANASEQDFRWHMLFADETRLNYWRDEHVELDLEYTTFFNCGLNIYLIVTIAIVVVMVFAAVVTAVIIIILVCIWRKKKVVVSPEVSLSDTKTTHAAKGNMKK